MFFSFRPAVREPFNALALLYTFSRPYKLPYFTDISLLLSGLCFSVGLFPRACWELTLDGVFKTPAFQPASSAAQHERMSRIDASMIRGPQRTRTICAARSRNWCHIWRLQPKSTDLCMGARLHSMRHAQNSTPVQGVCRHLNFALPNIAQHAIDMHKIPFPCAVEMQLSN